MTPVESSFRYQGRKITFADYGEGEPDRGFRPFNAQQEAAARKALSPFLDVMMSRLRMVTVSTVFMV